MSVVLGLSQETDINEHMSLGLDLSQEMESPKGKSSQVNPLNLFPLIRLDLMQK